jgi:hypothetical protein
MQFKDSNQKLLGYGRYLTAEGDISDNNNNKLGRDNFIKKIGIIYDKSFDFKN